MDRTQLTREQSALQAHLRLIEHAHEVRRLFEDAGMTLPPSVASLLGEPASNGQGSARSLGDQPRFIVTPPAPPPRPPESQKDWVWVPIKDLNLTTLVLGLLRPHDEPIESQGLFKLVQPVHKDANYKSMLNIGLRLDGALIERSDKGWRLTDKARAPVLFENHAWGPAGVFMRHEIAAHRRQLICHVLRASAPKGLQIVEIVRQLQNSSFCPSPVKKDLVKGDVQALGAEHRVRRVGNSKRWMVVEEQ